MLLRARGHREMPWKNGGGTTTEIATFPAGSSIDDFEWRVSLASVERAGPFSSFPGVDRSIALVEGRGMTLAFGDRGRVALDALRAPLSFPGELAVTASLTDGPVVDFNVMTRRGRFRHLLTRSQAPGVGRFAPLGTTAILVALRGTVRVSGRSLSPRDAVLLQEHEAIDVEHGADAASLVVDLWRW